MPSKYLEASIRIVKGQEWTGGWTTLVQHLEQVRYLAPLVVLNTALNGDYLFIFLQRFQPLWALEHRTFFLPLPAAVGCRPGLLPVCGGDFFAQHGLLLRSTPTP